jgi:putative ABC transport system permease protein
MLHRRFVIRELAQAGRQAVVFVLCVALSLITLVALNSFKNAVNTSILVDARTLQGGDIIVHSPYPFSPSLDRAVGDLERQGIAQGVRTYEFYSVVQTLDENGSLLAKIKVVGTDYPLYGKVRLKSGRPFSQVLGPGRIAVEQELLDRLHLRVGDQLHLGSAVLRIAGIATYEPDRPVNLFSLGPRIFVSIDDLARLNLIQKGSRIEYGILLKLFDQERINQVAAQLKEVAPSGQERVDTFRTARSGVKRFFDNLVFFLSLISVFTLFLAGIGMQSSLVALLRQKEKSIAITKALGADNGFLLRHYLVIVAILGLLGSGLGVLAGVALERFLPALFAGFIPVAGPLKISARDMAEGLLLGLVVVSLFTFLPLSRLQNVKPAAIFRNETSGARKGVCYYLSMVFGLLFLTGLVVRQLEDVKIGLYFMLGTLLLIAVIALMTRTVLLLSARITFSSLVFRQACRSLLRPGNATNSICTTLASALAVILSIYLVEESLHATYVASYPADAPNLFCLDIQADQKEAFTGIIPVRAQFYPIVRARLLSINGKRVNRQEELRKRRDNLSREFNLTYRDTLLSDERIVAGGSLFQRNWQGKNVVQVSILDTVADMGGMGLNDLLLFNIQGVPLEARVTSVRTRTRSRLYPYFYFIFPTPVLQDAPQTFFAALHVEKDSIAQLENRIVARFPNISVINMAETASGLGALLRRLSDIVNFFAAFSILAGGLIIVGSVFATRMERIREAVYYKILGSGSFFVISLFVYENMLLGLFSSLFGVILAQTGSWALCRFLLDIPYHPNLRASLVLILLTVLLVITVGLLSSITIVRQKPASFLREQGEEY